MECGVLMMKLPYINIIHKLHESFLRFVCMHEDRKLKNSKKKSILCTVDDLGQIFDLLSAWKLKSKNAPRYLKFNHNVAI